MYGVLALILSVALSSNGIDSLRKPFNFEAAIRLFGLVGVAMLIIGLKMTREPRLILDEDSDDKGQGGVSSGQFFSQANNRQPTRR